MNRAGNADQAARTCERFVYAAVKITRFYFVGEIHEVRRGLWAFILDCAFQQCWLVEQANSNNMDTKDRNKILDSKFITAIENSFLGHFRTISKTGAWYQPVEQLSKVLRFLNMDNDCTYVILQAPGTWHGRDDSPLTPDVPKHTANHNEEKEEVQACADGSNYDECILSEC